MSGAWGTYKIEVSDHAGANETPCTQAASESWRTLYFGPASAREARALVVRFGTEHRYARAFHFPSRTSALGTIFYEIALT